MNDAAQYESMPLLVEHPRAEHLPIWWRCMLVAMGMLILCSCAQPVSRTHLTPDKSLAQPPAQMQMVQVAPVEGSEVVVDQPGMPINAAMACDTGACGPMGGCCPGGDCRDPYGPVVGPSDEYLCDGGDYVTPAGVHADWSITGLEQEDAIAHYDTVEGRTIITPSNRVCIYAPRFAAVRRVVQPIAHEQPVFINEARKDQSLAKAADSLPAIAAKQRRAVVVDEGQQPPNLFRQRQQAGGLENLQATMDAFNAVSAYANVTIIRTGEVSGAEKALVERSKQAAIAWTGIQAAQVVFGVKQAHAQVGTSQPGVIYQTDEPNHPKLRLIKLASCGNAAPGEEVEFTLRYDNIGDQVIGNVTIVDNLSTRLEYVPETAKSSVDADFLTQDNDSGSLILRWEIRDPVKPGDAGVLRFRVKVR